MHSVTQTIGAYEVREGTRIPFASNHDKIVFATQSVCDSSSPQRWHGEVTFAGQTLIRTATVNDHEQAGRDAEPELTARIVKIFSA